MMLITITHINAFPAHDDLVTCRASLVCHPGQPILSIMALPTGEDFAAASSAHRKPTAIILEPSKDLAEQTHDFMVRFKQFLTQPQLRCELLIGGTNPKQGSRALEEGVDIITGTPGNPHTYTHHPDTHAHMR